MPGAPLFNLATGPGTFTAKSAVNTCLPRGPGHLPSSAESCSPPALGWGRVPLGRPEVGSFLGRWARSSEFPVTMLWGTRASHIPSVGRRRGAHGRGCRGCALSGHSLLSPPPPTFSALPLSGGTLASASPTAQGQAAGRGLRETSGQVPRAHRAVPCFLERGRKVQHLGSKASIPTLSGQQLRPVTWPPGDQPAGWRRCPRGTPGEDLCLWG